MKHQQIAYDFCLTHPHAGLFLGMGLGKTVTSLTVFSTYKWDYFTADKCLVIAPKNVAQNVWAQECRKWDHLSALRCSRVLGTQAQRISALKADADVYIINRENVVWLMDYLGGKLPFDMVIIDELSSFKSPSAKRWKALKKAIQTVPYVLGLTGTPAPNSYLDLWPEIYLLDGGKRLGQRIGQYRDRYFTAGAHKGHIVYEWHLRVGAKATIDRELKSLCLSMSAEDWLTLPPVIYNTIPVSMSAPEKKIYESLEKDKIIPLLENALVDTTDDDELAKADSFIKGDTAATIAGKLLQIANGAVYDDSGGTFHIHDRKLDALEEVVDTNPGENLLIFYAYKHDLERLLKRFPTAKVFSGEKDEAAWNRGEIPMLLCHPASTGLGLNLQSGGHIIIWFGLSWSLEFYQQANSRLPRPGQTQSVVIHHIICRDTIDERVMKVLGEKDTTQKSLLNALKGYCKEVRDGKTA